MVRARRRGARRRAQVVRQVVQAGGSVAVADHEQHVAALAPDLRWHVEGGAVEQVQPAGPTRGRRVVLEVELDQEQAPDVLRELRRRGLTPRVR